MMPTGEEADSVTCMLDLRFPYGKVPANRSEPSVNKP